MARTLGFRIARSFSIWLPSHRSPSPARSGLAPPRLASAPGAAPRSARCLASNADARQFARDGKGARMAVNKVFPDAKAALAGLLRDDMVIMSGGFGLCGIPSALIEAIRDSGVKGLTIISNNAGIDDVGLGVLLKTRQVRKMISSYVGENATFAQQYPGRRAGDRIQPAGHAGRAHSRRRRRVFRPSTPRPAPGRRSPRARRPRSSTAAPM